MISEGERVFETYWRIFAPALPAPMNGYKFHPKRKWEFDCAWPDKFLAVELNGGEFSGGRHVRGIGYQNDLEKLNAALDMGWRVYQYTVVMLKANPEGCVWQVANAWRKTRA